MARSRSARSSSRGISGRWSGRRARRSGSCCYRKIAGKRAWTDGPFTESKELVAGFSILELPSLADARAWAEGYAEVLGDNEVDVRVVAGCRAGLMMAIAAG